MKLVDGTGAVVVTYSYDAWGKPLSVDGTLATTLGKDNSFRHKGYYYDTETGLCYLNSRYYDPNMCRFINADDTDILFEEQGGLLQHNLFAYCLNNPVNMSDPSGHVAVSAVIGGIVGGVAGALLGRLLANALGLTGWKRYALIAGIAIAGAALGAFLGPYVAKLGAKAAAAIKSKLKIAAKTAKTVKKVIKGVCFVAGTLVKTDQGNVPIEQIKAGDYVYAEDPETGEKGLRRVVQLFENETNELVHITLNNEVISTTPEHPFYLYEYGWIHAIDLEVGDVLVLQNGRYVTIQKVQHEFLESPMTVYNFEVEGLHTYFVGENSVLVHNSCGKEFAKSPKNAKQVLSFLKDKGFSQVSQSGSHIKLVNGSKTVIVPNHGGKDIAMGTLKSIMKQAGLW